MKLPTSPRVNQLIKTVRQPQWIAALLSVGFHGVLFAASPSFSSLSVAALGNDQADAEERQVPLIELTPDEQGRLPDFSTPAYSLYPEGNDDLFSLFPPAGDSLPFDTDTEALRSSLSAPPSRLPSSAFPSSISPFGAGRTSIVIPPRRGSLPPIPSGSTLRRPAATSPAEGAESAASTPTATTSDRPTGGAADLMPGQGSGSEGGTERSQTTAALNPDAPNPDAPRAEQASDLLARVEYSDTQTSTAEVEIAKAAWLQTVKEKLGDTLAEAPEPITLQVPYSGRLCLSPEPTDGLLGLVALPDEEIEGLKLWTSVLKSTGYPFLNQAAEQALQGLQQEDDGESETLEPNLLYQVVVDIEYDSESCISREALLQSRMEDNQPETPETPVADNDDPETSAE